MHIRKVEIKLNVETAKFDVYINDELSDMKNYASMDKAIQKLAKYSKGQN